MSRLRTAQAALGTAILLAVLQGCGSDDSPPPKTVCGLDGELVATVLGSNGLSEGRTTNGSLSTVGIARTSFYNCDVKTDSYEKATVTAAGDSSVVGADLRAKMVQMPVRYTYEHGDAALKITSSGAGDAAVSSLDARWLCGPINIRVTATTHASIPEDDAKKLLDHAADEVGCEADVAPAP